MTPQCSSVIGNANRTSVAASASCIAKPNITRLAPPLSLQSVTFVAGSDWPINDKTWNIGSRSVRFAISARRYKLYPHRCSTSDFNVARSVTVLSIGVRCIPPVLEDRYPPVLRVVCPPEIRVASTPCLDHLHVH